MMLAAVEVIDRLLPVTLHGSNLQWPLVLFCSWFGFIIADAHVPNVLISNTDSIGRRGESLFCIEPEHIVCAPN